MAAPEPFVRYRGEKAPLPLPPAWRLRSVAAFEDSREAPDPAARVKEALGSPVGSAPLRRRLKQTDRVAVIIEDQTRASPKKAVLGALLSELAQAGIRPDRIDIVIALGTHRFLGEAEIARTYGEDIARGYRITNHDCRAADMVAIGSLADGTPVRINRLVADADFRIGVGSIFAHPLNGFGGGCKILFPGVADAASIMAHHLRHGFRGGSELGRLSGNPFYEQVCSLGLDGGLDFIVNSVLDHNDRFFEAVCGDPVQAHLAGVGILRRVISRPFALQADATVTSSFPYSEGPQIMKPLAPAALVTRPGGCIVLFADMTAPMPEQLTEACEAFRAKHAGRLRAAVLDHFEGGRPIVPGGAPELNMGLAQLLLTLNDYTLVVISDSLPPRTAERLGMRPAADFGQAARIVSAIRPDPEVHVIPAGGVILPEIR